MKLYEIDQQIIDCIDTETGEVVDVERLADLQLERDQKVEGVALYVKQLSAEANAIAAEVANLTERLAKKRKTAERLTEFIGGYLNGQRFETARAAITYRRSEAVHIANEDAVPDAYKKTKTETKPDKAAIKAALKAGKEVSGCSLVQRLNPQIK